jgi:glyoxylate reductase
MTERPKILVTQRVPDPAYPSLQAIGEVEANMEEGLIWARVYLLLAHR